jgi:hypothetical protein
MKLSVLASSSRLTCNDPAQASSYPLLRTPGGLRNSIDWCQISARTRKMTGGKPKPKNGNAPDQAKEAVFVSSEPVPEGVLPVRGIDFNLHKDRDISVVDLVEGMSNMGFQASAIGDAVRIINEMVRRHLCHPANTLEGGL